MKTIFYGILTVLGLSALYAQESQVRYSAQPESKMWLRGSSTVGKFTCLTTRVEGSGFLAGELPTADDSTKQVGNNEATVSVTVYVRTFDCGNDLMNNDMYNAMKDQEFPLIEYELVSAERVDTSSEKSWFEFNTLGTMTIAGVRDTVEIPIKARRLPDGRYEVVGKKALSMLDFGITPPSAFFGLIRAHKQLTIHFSVIAGTESIEHTHDLESR